MKAFLLVAGQGLRLRPLTERVPKCLVPIAGRPLLGIWFDLLKRHGVDEVLLNLHHLPEKVEAFVRDNAHGLRVRTVHEPTLVGSAGTVAANRDFVEDEDRFLVVYGDNLTDMDVSAMLAFHDKHGGDFTIGLFRTPNPRACGIVDLDRDQRVVSFVEKPADPASDLANAGIYVASDRILDEIPRKVPADFGFDVLPRLVGRMYGWPIDGYFLDIGTPENYARANRDWASRTH